MNLENIVDEMREVIFRKIQYTSSILRINKKYVL